MEEAAFSISISSNVFIFMLYYGHGFFYCFHFISFLKDMFREFGFTFCVSEIFPMLSKFYVEVVVVRSSYIKFAAVGSCQFIKPLPVIFVVQFNFIWYYILQFFIGFVGYFYIFLSALLIVLASLVDSLPVFVSVINF